MYKHYLTILSTRIEVFPLNFNSTTLTDERERDQIFYRRKFGGTLRFYGDDFYLLHIAELTAPCEYIIYEIEKKVSGTCDTYENYWIGQFSTTDGKFDLDRCTFDITPLPDDIYSDFIDKGNTEYNILTLPLVTTHTSGFTYTRNRWLIDVIEYIAEQIVPGVIVTSRFFTEATNYVTGIENRMTLLTIAQKSDIKRPGSSNPATIAMLSFNELMEILRMFNVYWDYDGELIIEHISYFESLPGMDLRGQVLAEKSNKYSYLKEKMPKFERFSFMEASNSDFIGVPIRYESKCINPDPDSNISEYTNRVTTDISMIEIESESVVDEGFVIFCNYLYGGNYYVYFTIGRLSLTSKYNNDLSWANLHHAFFKHNRVLSEGYMNNSLTEFASIQKNKQQEVLAKVCREDNYDPRDYITTELGEIHFLGEKASVMRSELKPSGEMRFLLLYGETNLSGESEPEPLVMLIIEDLLLHNNSYVRVYLSAAAPYDMTFWIWVNETNCDEFVILTGEMFHEELITANIGMDPIEYGDLKYNLHHSSLDGWEISYWGNEAPYADHVDFPLIEITDVECGDSGGTPPPPVAPEVILEVKDGETWYIDNDSGSIAIGSTTLSITFMPHDCTLPGSHLIYIKVSRNAVFDVYDQVYAKELFQCNKNISVTQAQSGDVYAVELSENSYT